MSERPLKWASMREMAKDLARYGDNPQVLTALDHELSFRFTEQARRLQEQVRARRPVAHDDFGAEPVVARRYVDAPDAPDPRDQELEGLRDTISRLFQGLADKDAEI
ncbi:MAG: hypothetical protein AAFZ09_18985, partial [Pseudomonadota bacterium]